MFDRCSTLVGATTFLVSIASLPTAVFADGPFISLLVGGVETEDVAADDIDVEYDTGFAFAGQFGYKFDQFRIAGEFGYQLAEGLSENDVNADVGITRFVINGYVDLPIAPNFDPYVGGGFGVANVRAGEDLNDDFEDQDTAFTWHGEVGLSVGVTDHFSIAPAYRYQWIDTDIGGQTEPLISHIFGVSLRYQFHAGGGSSAYSAESRAPRDDYYDGGYSSYRSRDPFDRYDRYDRYDDDRYYRHEKRRKTPEELERDRCGWKGPGCEDEDNGG